MFKALIDRQDNHFACAAKPTVRQDSGKVSFGAGAVTFIFCKDITNQWGKTHLNVLC
jgi:hypothetical protein